MIWRVKNRDIDLSSRALVMGILNVTPDSFSDGGKYACLDRAVQHSLEMSAQGADIIDVGGESTRPGALPVPAGVEMERVLPLIERLAGLTDRLISIDTNKSAVAEAAVLSGAHIINNVSGLREDAMIDVAARTGAGVIAMHMKGTPADMQTDPHYDDVVSEVANFFRQTFDRAVALGLRPMSIAFDPGIGFGKSVTHNLLLLKNLALLRVADRPLVVGVSRKSFLGKILGSAEMGDRLAPTIALTGFARERGANVVRVHDVRPNVQALRVTEAILGTAC